MIKDEDHILAVRCIFEKESITTHVYELDFSKIQENETIEAEEYKKFTVPFKLSEKNSKKDGLIQTNTVINHEGTMVVFTIDAKDGNDVHSETVIISLVDKKIVWPKMDSD